MSLSKIKFLKKSTLLLKNHQQRQEASFLSFGSVKTIWISFPIFDFCFAFIYHSQIHWNILYIKMHTDTHKQPFFGLTVLSSHCLIFLFILLWNFLIILFQPNIFMTESSHSFTLFNYFHIIPTPVILLKNYYSKLSHNLMHI